MRVLIVDDEPLARARLVRLVEALADMTVVGQAEDGAGALHQIAALQPDVVLLDIDMPGLDGLAVAERPGMPPIIFTTAHARFAVDAFAVDAYDFVLKPVTRERLEQALAKVRTRGAPPERQLGTSPSWQLAVEDAGTTRLVDVRTVSRLYALDKYVAFLADGREHLVRESLDELGERLAEHGFMRVHRGELIRVGSVVALEPTESGLVAKLADGQEARVSRRLAPSLRAALGLG